MQPDLFLDPPRSLPLAPGAVLLVGFARAEAPDLLSGISSVIAAAPLRHMTTPGNHVMSVAMTNCGALGWVSDAAGSRFSPVDPLSGAAWPPMPALLSSLAARAAAAAGFAAFSPDACL